MLSAVCVSSFLQNLIHSPWAQGERKKAVIFQSESSVLLVHGKVAIIHFKNSILQLKQYLSVMGAGILSIAKLKLSITLIKSTALRVCTHTQTHTEQMFLLCSTDIFI